MSSSNAAVRKAISDADLSDIFFASMSSSNPLASAYSCVALAKLCAADDDIRSMVLTVHEPLSKVSMRERVCVCQLWLIGCQTLCQTVRLLTSFDNVKTMPYIMLYKLHSKLYSTSVDLMNRRNFYLRLMMARG